MSLCERIGPLTVTRYKWLKAGGMHLRVFVGEQDVTDRCFYADDRPGFEEVRLFKVNDKGRRFREGNEVAEETICGKQIRIVEIQ